MNNFFNEIKTFLQIEKDTVNLYEFCSVSINTSIDLTIDKRTNNALLNYQFIDSFVKLIVLLLKAFEFNKQEFIQKILENISKKLEQDHL